MNIKQIIKKIPGVRNGRNKIVFAKEYSYDKKLFSKNYSHSSETKEKLGYNMLLISPFA